VTIQGATNRRGPTERARPRIRLQLTALYAATLLLVLLGTATLLRFAMRSALEREFDASMRSSALAVRNFFRLEISEFQTIELTLQHMAGELVFEERTVRITRPDGTAFETVGSPARQKAVRLTAPVRTLTLPLDVGLAPGWTMVIEASAAATDAVEQQIDRWFLIGIPGVVLLAAGIGWWLTGRTLRPVGRMADAAMRIAPASGARLPVNDPTDELGRLGTTFNGLLERLDGALLQQRRFLADAAHELRTPLARMRARLEVAALGRDNASPVLSELQEDLLRMSRQVDELLQLARADAGEGAGHERFVSLYLDDLVTDELQRWQHDATRAGITLTASVLHEAPTRADETLIGRLLGILLDNALRYGHRGGHVDLRVQVDGEFVMLEVEDDGIGIPRAERARIFDRFFRGDEARRLRADGSGLGLAIAAWIVQLHGGTIGIDAAPGDVGTLVTVRLPRAAP
jgi:two-component system OmpR family sensor kinase